MKSGWMDRHGMLILGLVFLLGGIGSIGAGTFGVWKLQFGETATAVVCFAVGAALCAGYILKLVKSRKQ